MTVFVPESIHILGTDGGGLSVVLCSMYVDTLADLPSPTAYTGYRLSMGCTARVINDNSMHRINSAGQWVDITENDGKYTLPPATSNSLGGIMVGSGLTIDSAGMLSGDFSALWDSIYQTEKHLTGVPPLSFMASGNGIEAAVIYGNGQQTGTPTPDAPIMPTFCGVRTANLWNAIKYSYTSLSDSSVWVYSSSLTGSVYRIPCMPNTKYTLYLAENVSISIWRICEVSTDVVPNASSASVPTTGAYASAVPASKSATFTTSASAKYILFQTNETAYDSVLPAIMLIEGNTKIPYEPYGYKIPITCAGQTVPVYLGQTQTVREVKKLVLTGEENWRNVGGNAPYQITLTDIVLTTDRNSVLFLSSHYLAVSNNASWSQYSTCVSWEFSGNVNVKCLQFRDTNQATLADFKAYLSEQYAAGTPVTVWYILATPETGIVNEPLAKIGDYADELHSADAGISIQTVRGQNTLTIGTKLQPSKISITYF